MSRKLRDKAERPYLDPDFGRWKVLSKSTGDLRDLSEKKSVISTMVQSLNPFHGLTNHYASMASLHHSQTSRDSNRNSTTHTTAPDIADHTVIDQSDNTSFTTCTETHNMDTQQPSTKLTPAYYQARSARRAKLEQTSHSVSTSINQHNNSSTPQPDLGTFDGHHYDISTCYIATKNTTELHQNITASFDPATLTCVTCTKPHIITDDSGDGSSPPLTVVVSDQCFPPFAVSNDGKNCVKVVRIEDGSLIELCDIFCDIFTNANVPAGTVALIGFGLHLLRSGSSVYARAWIGVANCLEKKFPNVSLCPLPPVLSQNVPGCLFRSSLEFVY